MLDLEKDCCFFPETIFMLGTRYEYLGEAVREADRKKHLSLRNIVDATPPVWLHLGQYHLGRRMVTNGEYLRFLEHHDQAAEGAPRLYNTADLWQYVWNKMELRFLNAHIPFRENLDAPITLLEEDYHNVLGFVDAYLKSLHYESRRILLATQGEELEPSRGGTSTVQVRRSESETRRSGSPREEILMRVFAAMKYFLRFSLTPEGEAPLTDVELQLLNTYSEPAQFIGEATSLIADLRKGYKPRVDKRSQMLINKVVEPLQFLDRFVAAVKKRQGFQEPIPLHEVLYPRSWASPAAQAKKRAFGGKQEVPWEDQPVYGITLYEAAAYTAWLAFVSGQPVCLPTEAEMERASSWPIDPPEEREGAFILDPSRKNVFPWQEHNPKDFNSHFGMEGQDIANNYLVDQRKYQVLLDETERPVGEQGSLVMLEGFGWQWTSDRYSDIDRKYMRFQSPDYPEHVDPAGRAFVENGPEGHRLRVLDYRPHTNMNCSHFVLKGSPEVLGGCGMTVRRFAAFPLRAYPNVGFRIAVRETPA